MSNKLPLSIYLHEEDEDETLSDEQPTTSALPPGPSSAAQYIAASGSANILSADSKLKDFDSDDWCTLGCHSPSVD